MDIRSSRSLRIAAASLVLTGTALLGTAATAGASGGCGEYSFGFEGTRLLNDGISDSAGPFSIELPAGTYTVTTESFDDHAAHPGQVEQTAEQWYIVLDSGYVSPLTSDVPEDGNFVADTFANQTIEASSSITLRHRGEGGVNSVSPLCVGFTTVAVAEEVPVEEIVEEEVVIEVAGPELEAVEIEVAGVTEIAEPAEAIAVAGPVAPEETVVEAPATPAETAAPARAVVEVDLQAAPAVAQPAEELALTGPTSLTWAMVAAATASLAAGGALLLEERRRLA